jgi:hypothetical protein
LYLLYFFCLPISSLFPLNHELLEVRYLTSRPR